SRTIEAGLWVTIVGYHRELTQSYRSYAKNHAAAKITALLPLVTLRTFNHLAKQIKWHGFRYEPVDMAHWKRLHQLYKFSETEGFQRQELKLYAQDDIPTSCADQYLQVLMLDTLNLGNLAVKQIEMVDRWLDSWSHTLVLRPDLDEQHDAFYVNLEEGHGAKRVRRVKQEAHLRFWSTEALVSLLDQIMGELREGEESIRARLGDDCRLPACLEFIEDIKRVWTVGGVKRQQRVHERKPVVKSIDVIAAFQDICAQIGHDLEYLAAQRGEGDAKPKLSYEEMVDIRLYGFVTRETMVKVERKRAAENRAAVTEQWTTDNESEGGCGAVIPPGKSTWLRIGRLVGLRSATHPRYMLGVIRRLSKTAANESNVGIEFIATRPINVTLRSRGGEHRFTVEGMEPVNVKAAHSAVYITGEPGQGAAENTLVVESLAYAKGREYDLLSRGKCYVISLGDVAEKGIDWLRINFRVLRKLEEPYY
ncbi:MAG: hypothetical protein ACREUA_07050, partial [Burkholderiales bacterium]